MIGDTDDEQDNGLPESEDDENAGDGTGPFHRMEAQLAAVADRCEAAVRAQMRIQHTGQMFDRILENLDQLDELRERIQQYHEEVREAVESTIELDEPWEYDPDESTVQDRAEQVARSQLLHLMEELLESDDPYFDPLLYRMRVGYDAYTGRVPDEDGEYVNVAPRMYEGIFVFMSLQDALMHWLCEQDSGTEWDRQHGDRNEYFSNTKKERLKEAYVSSHGLASARAVENNLDAFYHHRNYVMHSNPEAYFDMNIATAAVLFFVLTLHTVLEELEDAE